MIKEEDEMTKLDANDLNILGEIVDLAVKAGGFGVAERAFPVVAKMRQMMQELNQPVAQTEEVLPGFAEAAE